jgi:hypothetical protein
MKLKRVHFENFQCIGDATTIDLAPLTLLFGTNSAGKSAIADALELLSQLLSKTADPDLVRRWMKDDAEQMKIGLGYEIENHGLDRFLERAGLTGILNKDPAGYLEFETDHGYSAAYQLLESAQKKPRVKGESEQYLPPEGPTEIDLLFSFSRSLLVAKEIGITEATLIINGVELVSIKDQGRYVDLNLAHPKNDISKWRFGEVIVDIGAEIDSFIEEFKDEGHKLLIERSSSNVRFKYLFDPFDGLGLRDGFARNARGAGLEMYVHDIDYDLGDDYVLPSTEETLQEKYLGNSLSDSHVRCIDRLRWAFHGLVVLPARAAGALAGSMVRVGPLRTIPSVNDLMWEESKHLKWRDNFYRDSLIDEEWYLDYRVMPPLGSWLDGKSAWKYLTFNSNARADVNRMLSDQLGIGLDYEVSCQRFSLVPSPERVWTHNDETNEGKYIERPEPTGSPEGALSAGMLFLTVHVRDTTRNLSLRPEDVGSGVSQVIPVLAALAKDQLVSFIEQPELHLHPRAQSKMGDIFLEHAMKSDRYKHDPVCIVETHSEHLALRVLRRVREAGKASDSPTLEEKVIFYYFKKVAGNTSVHRIQIDSSGRFVDSWPDGFFEDRLEDLFS